MSTYTCIYDLIFCEKINEAAKWFIKFAESNLVLRDIVYFDSSLLQDELIFINNQKDLSTKPKNDDSFSIGYLACHLKNPKTDCKFELVTRFVESNPNFNSASFFFYPSKTKYFNDGERIELYLSNRPFKNFVRFELGDPINERLTILKNDLGIELEIIGKSSRF